MSINREGGNISGTSVELVKIRLKKGTRKTRSDNTNDNENLELDIANPLFSDWRDT